MDKSVGPNRLRTRQHPRQRNAPPSRGHLIPRDFSCSARPRLRALDDEARPRRRRARNHDPHVRNRRAIPIHRSEYRCVGAMWANMAFNESPREYLANANGEIVVIVQIESRRAVENCEEIAAVEEVDMPFFLLRAAKSEGNFWGAEAGRRWKQGVEVGNCGADIVAVSAWGSGMDPTDGTLRQYFTCRAHMAIPIPEDMSWEQAGAIQPPGIAVQLERRAALTANKTLARMVFGYRVREA